MSTSAPPDEVVLLADDGSAVGTAPRRDVHGTDTPLHLAFSLHLLDPLGRTLLTRRALGKVAWPGVWTNSCCGHPRPGEHLPDAVRRRVGEELGVRVGALECVLPDFRYRAVDPGGVVENEVCPVFVARVGDEVVRHDPSEVAEHAWVDWASLVAAACAAPMLLSPWAARQIPLLDALVGVGTPSRGWS